MGRKLCTFFLTAVVVLFSGSALAADTSPLGLGNLAFKVDYFSFSDSDWEDLGLDDGVYLGVEGYGQVANNFYLGAEFGYFNEDNSIFFSDGTSTIDGEFEVTYMPVEFNMKYAFAPAPQVVFDLGGGLSYNYTELEFTGEISDQSFGFSGTASEDEWLFGGQLFADVNFVFDAFFFGANGKYQFAEEFDEFDIDVDNWRFGGQFGFLF